MIRFQTPSRTNSQPRPTLWRLTLAQCAVWLVAGLVCVLLAYEHTASLLWSGLITIAAQGFWIWRTLSGFGDPGSTAYFAATTVGMIGKWAIIFVGLVLLWRYRPDVSVAVSIATVFALNTLAALAAPVLISRPRRRATSKVL